MRIKNMKSKLITALFCLLLISNGVLYYKWDIASFWQMCGEKYSTAYSKSQKLYTKLFRKHFIGKHITSFSTSVERFYNGSNTDKIEPMKPDSSKRNEMLQKRQVKMDELIKYRYGCTTIYTDPKGIIKNIHEYESCGKCSD